MQPEPENVNILLVDDEPKNLTALEAVLAGSHRNLVKAYSGEEALKCLLRDDFAVILLDVYMAGMDGFETAALIRERERSRHTPIIFLTAANKTDTHVSRGYSLGAVDYIFKPIEPEILRPKVAVFVELFRKTQQVRRQAEQLTETTAFLQNVLESSTAYSIIATDLAGQILVWNEGARRNYGYTAEQMVGRQNARILHSPADIQMGKVHTALATALEVGKLEGEFEHVRKDGQRFAAELAITLRRDAAGNAVGYVLVSKDVTERKLLIREQAARAEAEAAQKRSAFLAEASKRLTISLDYRATLSGIARLAVPTIADCCLIDVVEENGQIRRVETVHADPAKEAQLRELQRRYSPSSDAPEGMAKVLRTGESELVAEVSDVRQETRTHPADRQEFLRVLEPRSYVIVPLLARGRTLGALAFIVADSDRRYGRADLALAEDLAYRTALAVDNARLYATAERERAQLEEANRTKDEFLATVSHELRTPLTGILGWAQLLRRGSLDEAGRARAIERLESNARAQAQVIEDLLDVSRIITGKLRLAAHPLELAPVIEAAIDTVRPAADAKAIELEAELDPAAGPVAGDADRLQQVVWNLLTNAIKFTPREGHVKVGLARSEAHVEITVSDTGQGIRAEFLPYVFDRFRQADSTSTRAHGGLGLGLAIVRHLVELHGGTVQAASAGEGHGATFTVRLPVAVERQEPGRVERLQPAVGSAVLSQAPALLDSVRVLLVDDDADARELLTAMLTEYGAAATAVASAAEALEALEWLRPAVLISDIGMPGEDGYALIRQVRAREPERGGQVPAVALTAYARSEDRTRALAAGFQMHVSKPVDPAELAAVVAHLAGRAGTA